MSLAPHFSSPGLLPGGSLSSLQVPGILLFPLGIGSAFRSFHLNVIFSHCSLLFVFPVLFPTVKQKTLTGKSWKIFGGERSLFPKLHRHITKRLPFTSGVMPYYGKCPTFTQTGEEHQEPWVSMTPTVFSSALHLTGLNTEQVGALRPSLLHFSLRQN